VGAIAKRIAPTERMIGGLRLRLIRLRPDPYPHCGDLCAWDRPSRKRGGCCVSCARHAHHAPRHQRPSTIAHTFRLTIRFSMPPSRCPVRVRVLSRGIAMAERDAASCGFANARKLPGGFGTPPSATTSGREELADGEASLASSRAGPEPINRRGGAPRGERPASWDVRRLASACGRTSFARRRVPLHPSACRRSASLTW